MQVWNLRVLHTPLAIAYAASTVQVQGIVQCAQLYNVSSILQLKTARSNLPHWPSPFFVPAKAALSPSGWVLLISANMRCVICSTVRGSCLVKSPAAASDVCDPC